MTPEERVSLSRGDDEHERKAIQDVLEFGVHILHVFDPDGENPRFSYTVGLWHHHQHPEVILFGLKEELCHSVLNTLNDEIADGKSFLAESSSLEILEGFRCYFEKLPKDQYESCLGWARWFYGGDDFEAVQLIWPNTSGVFPWQSNADEHLRWMEPILTKRPLLVS